MLPEHPQGVTAVTEKEMFVERLPVEEPAEFIMATVRRQC